MRRVEEKGEEEGEENYVLVLELTLLAVEKGGGHSFSGISRVSC